jgi:hypothetical protein
VKARPDRSGAQAALGDEFRRLTDQRLLCAADPVIAANHFVWPVAVDPVNKVMFIREAGISSAAELQHYADAAVGEFLSAYRRA